MQMIFKRMLRIKLMHLCYTANRKSILKRQNSKVPKAIRESNTHQHNQNMSKLTVNYITSSLLPHVFTMELSTFDAHTHQLRISLTKLKQINNFTLYKLTQNYILWVLTCIMCIKY